MAAQLELSKIKKDMLFSYQLNRAARQTQTPDKTIPISTQRITAMLRFVTSVRIS
jgi:hypothetical protein